MPTNTVTAKNNNKLNKQKILLVLLPFWTPLIPPLGISCLKSFLQDYEYEVKTVDINVEYQFKEKYDRYFKTLEKYVPGNRRGNFYNIGQEVLRNHMMIHFRGKQGKENIELVKNLVYQTFFCLVDDHHVSEMNQVLEDFYLELEKYFLALLDREKPDVLGLSVYIDTLPASMFAARLTRENYPHIKIVMGGGIFADQLAIGSPNLEFFLEKSPYVDKIIIGEGEILFLKLLAGELAGAKRVYTLEEIKGQTLNLDSANIPDFNDFNLTHYFTPASYASRSCPFQCSFCTETVQWGKYRKKNAKKVVEELWDLHKRHSCKLFLMVDSLLNPIITPLANEFIKQKISLYWDGYLRVDEAACDIENSLLWRRGGFYRARLGVESGSTKVLEMMKKKITTRQIKETICSLASAGIKTTTYWVIGHPGETEKDFLQTLDLIEELKEYIYEAECNPFHYYLTGQVNSNNWFKKSKRLYPEHAGNLLITETWILDCQPSRKEIYNRVSRFVQHCRKLAIPNPYSITDILQADQRWKKLHKNAVPPLIEVNRKDANIDEWKEVKSIHLAKNKIKVHNDWDFDF